MEIKSARQIFFDNIPKEIVKEGYSLGDIDHSLVEKAMKEYAEQFIDLALKESITICDEELSYNVVEKKDLENIKQLIK